MADEKVVTIVLPTGTKVTCTEELAARLAPKKAEPKPQPRSAKPEK